MSKSTTPENSATLPVIGHSIPYERFLDCVHCGLCTAACPTYVETGNENDGPRGRIYLMRAVVDGRLPLTQAVRGHLDSCLDCRSCETACPSGVQYGRLLEPFRVEMQAPQHPSAAATASQANPTSQTSPTREDWFHRFILYGLFPYRRRLQLALLPARLMQRLNLDKAARRLGLTRLLPKKLQRMESQLPKLKSAPPELPEFLPAIGPRRARVGLFIGCVADAMFRHVHWATARVLQQNGCDVIIPSSQACCGAIHYHSGAAGPALELMHTNATAFHDPSLDAVIVNVAGCGSMLKDYSHIIHELQTHQPKSNTPQQSPNPSRFAAKVRDIHEFLMQLGPVLPTGRINAVVALQDACHLQHAQKIRREPRDLLKLIPGIELKSIAEPELCCGAAGTYNLTQPDMADRLGRRKVNCLLDAKPTVIASANAGCSLQLQAHLQQQGQSVPVLHPIELLDASYRNAPLNSL
ncbi:MAG: Lactate utilization protein [Planctomycetota bacterium]